MKTIDINELKEMYDEQVEDAKMKTYELDKLFETKKAKKIIDENLSSYNDEDVIYAILEINY